MENFWYIAEILVMAMSAVSIFLLARMACHSQKVKAKITFYCMAMVAKAKAMTAFFKKRKFLYSYLFALVILWAITYLHQEGYIR